MVWNEPNKDQDKDRNRNQWDQSKRDKNAPPDLDEALRKLQRKLTSLFGSKTKGPDDGKSNGKTGMTGKIGMIGSGLVIAALFGVWLLSGIYIVDPAEQAVVLRLGKYVDTVGPGPHWIPRLIDSKYVIDVQKVANFSYQSPMLTKDENIVNVEMAVQYQIDNTKDYLFNVVNPQASLQQAAASALRQVVGHTTLDNILTTGREVVRSKVTEQLNKVMQLYRAGIIVTDVTLQPARAPEEVKSAFDDAIKAQEDEQRYINQAEAYARGVEPIAQGQAKRFLQEAAAYKQQVILQAQGNVANFLALLPEYQKAPGVTRERMYLDTVESVLSHTSKILVDSNNSHNMFYLPLPQSLQQSSTTLPAVKANLQPNAEDSNAANTNLNQYPSRPIRESYNGRRDV